MITFPGKDKSTKEIILSILGSFWPLTIKQIHHHIVKDYNRKISYQAIYKFIKELKSKEIIIYTDGGYQLSYEWIKNSYAHFHRLKDSYSEKHCSKQIMLERDVTTLTFKNLSELDIFYFDLYDSIIPNSQKNSMVFYIKHNWRPLLYPTKNHRTIKESKKKILFLIAGNTPLDKWCCNFEEKSGAIPKILKGYPLSNDLYILDDLIIQVYIPKQIIEKMDLLFNSTKNINDLDLDYILKNIMDNNAKITVVLNRNEELAKQIFHQAKELIQTKK